MSDFFQDSGNFYIRTNPDNSLSFIYGLDEIFSQRAEDIIHFPDQNFSYQSYKDIPVLPPGLVDTISFDYSYQFITDTVGQRLDSMLLKNGQMYIHCKTNLNRDEANATVLIPEIVNIASGEPLKIFAPVNNPGGQEAWVEFEESIDLTGYKTVFTADSPGGNNSITFLLEIVFQGDNNPDLSPYEFNFDGYLRDIEFEKIFGYIGHYEIPFSDSIDISLFDKTILGGIQVGPGAVDIYMDVHNSIGTPVMFAATELYVTSTKNPPYHVDIHLFGAGLPNIFPVDAPDINQIGQSIETNLDFSNSNLGQAFNIAPEMFYFDLLAMTNPMGDTTVTNFLLDTSRISMDMSLEVRLFTAISNFVVEDTVDFIFDEDPGFVNNLLIRLNATNRFPLNANLQVYFADNGYNVLDSLIDNPDNKVLVGAPVGGPPEYRVTDSTNQITDFNLSEQKIQTLLKAEKLLFRVALSTTGEQLAIIYDDYSISIKIGTIAGINLTNQ
jgi:hypothetical protein